MAQVNTLIICNTDVKYMLIFLLEALIRATQNGCVKKMIHNICESNVNLLFHVPFRFSAFG